MAKFRGAIFGTQANFSGVTAGDFADLSDAIFGDWVDLSCATFGAGADFSGTTFGESTNLSCAIFGNKVNFSGATFRYRTDLSGAVFGSRADFARATFEGRAGFTARSIDDWKKERALAVEQVPIFRAWSQERKDAFVTLDPELLGAGAGPDAFSDISFADARFFRFADFARRKFSGRCDFTGAHFSAPPSFDKCEHPHRLDLYGAKISFAGLLLGIRTPGWTGKSDVANRLRRLRELAAATNNHDLERDLYIEERRAERGVLLAHALSAGWRSLLSAKLYSHCLWIGVMAVFALFADYGRSFVRPLIALALSVPLFWWGFAATVQPPSDKRGHFDDALTAFTIAGALPFVGTLTLEKEVKLTVLCGGRPLDRAHARRDEEICTPVPGPRFQLLALGQSIFSGLCIFFAGLALRNYFKLK